MKKKEYKAVEKKLVTGSLIWLMSPGRINCSTGTSLGRERDGTSCEHKTPRFVDVEGVLCQYGGNEG